MEWIITITIPFKKHMCHLYYMGFHKQIKLLHEFPKSGIIWMLVIHNKFIRFVDSINPTLNKSTIMLWQKPMKYYLNTLTFQEPNVFYIDKSFGIIMGKVFLVDIISLIGKWLKKVEACKIVMIFFLMNVLDICNKKKIF